jgi:hypothetical protein
MKAMKIILMGLLFVVVFTMGCSHHWGYDRYHRGGYGYGEYQQEGWSCPWCGGHGSGMMGPGYGHGGMGPGMMGPYGGRGGRGPGYGGYESAEPLTQDQAKVLVERSISLTRNPNIKLGMMRDKKKYFEAEIVTKDGSLVDTIQVDKKTGWFRSMH